MPALNFSHHIPALLVITPMLGALVVGLLGLWRRRLVYPLVIITQVLFTAFAYAGLCRVLRYGTESYPMAGWPPPFGIELVMDLLSAFIIAVIATVATAVLIASRASVTLECPKRHVAFYSLALILEMGLAGMVITGDLFNLYVFLEVASLAAYALMGLGQERAPLAAFRYLVLGTIGASLYLLGIGFLYVQTGSLNMADVTQILSHAPPNPIFWISLAMIVTGLGLKMALFPMHRWLPDAYTYASSTATALIAPLMTKISAYAIIRMVFFIYAGAHPDAIRPVMEAVAWLSCIGIVVGSVMAMPQQDFKRMLAYSSISQISLIGLGIGMATPLALVGALLHILNHALMKSCLFLAASGINLKNKQTRLSDLEGLGRRMPWTGAAITTAALAMVGIPPTVGFFSKWYLVLAAIENQQWIYVVVILFSSLLTAVYMFRVIELMYTKPQQQTERDEVPWSLRLPQTALAIALLVVGAGTTWLVQHVLMKAVAHV